MDKHLSDQLFARKVFHCVYCKDVLQPPVMLVEKTGNMCFPCYETFKVNNNIIAMENAGFTAIFEQLEICCEYATRGCNKRIKPKHYKKHKEECIYQSFNCNLSPECYWNGCVEELIAHSRKDHPDRILKNTDDCCRFFDIQNQKDGDYILETSRGFFVFTMKKSRSDLMLLIYDFSFGKEDTEIHFDVTFSMYGAKHTQRCIAIKDFKSFLEFDESLRITFDLNSVNNMLLSRNSVLNLSSISLLFCREITADMSINLVDTDSDCVLNDAICKQLTCLICNSYIKSDIYCCVNGHNICAPCRSKTPTSCKICSQPGTTFHNISLEKLADLVRLSCKFREKGCVMKIPRRSGHEFSCYYSNWDCFIGGCTSTFSYPDLVLHAKDIHQVPSGFKCLPNLTMKRNTNEKIVYHVIEYNLIFELIYQSLLYTQYNQYGSSISGTQYIWSVDIIRGYDPEPFIFEIVIIFGDTDSVKDITLRGNCRDKRTVEFTKQPIKLDDRTLPELSRRNSFDYNIRVFKEK